MYFYHVPVMNRPCHSRSGAGEAGCSQRAEKLYLADSGRMSEHQRNSNKVIHMLGILCALNYSSRTNQSAYDCARSVRARRLGQNQINRH
jgi:hypothetical protein